MAGRPVQRSKFISTHAIQAVTPRSHGRCRQAPPWPNSNCTARAAKPTTHFFICCQLSRIQQAEFTSGSSHDFSPSVPTLITSAPSLVPSRVPTRSNGRQRFPRYFSTSNPRFEVGRLKYQASHTLYGWRHFRPRMFHRSAYPPDTVTNE